MNDERPEPPETQAGVSFGRVARFAASAAAIGLLAVVVRPYTKLGDAHLDAIGGVVLVTGFALYAAVRPHGRRPQLSFQLTSAALWLSFFGMMDALGTTGALAMTLPFGVVFAAVGGLITHRRSRRRADA